MQKTNSPVTCAYCGKTIEPDRRREINFCSDKHRIYYHREQLQKKQAQVAVQILGQLTGLSSLQLADGTPAHESLHVMSRASLLKAMRDAGYKWNKKKETFLKK